MRLLVTRAREDAEALARELRRRGVEPHCEPLLEIRQRTDASLDLAGVQAIAVTSANGARALAAAHSGRDVTVYAVGDASARAALEAGFGRVESAGGDVGALARLMVARLDPAAGSVLHVGASHLAGDLARALEGAGFAYGRAVLYEARTATALSPETARLLAGGGIDGVLFFSPRTAATFVSLAGEAGLAEACARLVAFCLSPAVVAALGPLAWRDVRVARHPDQESLLACVGRAMAGTAGTMDEGATP